MQGNGKVDCIITTHIHGHSSTCFSGMCRLFAEFACVRSLYTMLIDGLEHGFDFSILGI